MKEILQAICHENIEVTIVGCPISRKTVRLMLPPCRPDHVNPPSSVTSAVSLTIRQPLLPARWFIAMSEERYLSRKVTALAHSLLKAIKLGSITREALYSPRINAS